jgi:hypothetical protein
VDPRVDLDAVEWIKTTKRRNKMIHIPKFNVLTVVAMNIALLWDVTPCSLVHRYRRFGTNSYLHLEV